MYLRMVFRGRVESSAQGGELRYELTPTPGGRLCKVALYSVKVLQTSGDDVRMGLDLQTGPDGDVYGAVRQLFNDWSPGTAMPTVRERASGTPDTNADDVLGEWLRPTIRIKDVNTTTAQWALIEVWELRKPF